MGPSPIQLIIAALVILLLFGGRGRISSIMGDMAKGISSFRKGLKDEDEAPTGGQPGEIARDGLVDVTPEKRETKVS